MLMFKSTYERLLQEERRKREDQRDLVRKTEDENYRLKEKIIKLELDLKIAKMYIDDDEALLELIELHEKKSNINTDTFRISTGYAGYLGQAQRDALYKQYAPIRRRPYEMNRSKSPLGHLGGVSNNALFF